MKPIVIFKPNARILDVAICIDIDMKIQFAFIEELDSLTTKLLKEK